ncbi:MAG: hypothetical protein ACFB11_23580 [Paracoccaceae bacterium]
MARIPSTFAHAEPTGCPRKTDITRKVKEKTTLICFLETSLVALVASLGMFSEEYNEPVRAGLVVGKNIYTGAVEVKSTMTLGVDPNGKPLPGYKDVFLWVAKEIASDQKIKISFFERSISGQIFLEPTVFFEDLEPLICFDASAFSD